MLSNQYNNLELLEILNMIKGYVQVCYNIESDKPVIYLCRKNNYQTEKITHTDKNSEHKQIYDFLVTQTQKIYLDLKTTEEQKTENMITNNGIKIKMNSLNGYSGGKKTSYMITLKIDVLDALTRQKNYLLDEITGSVNLRKL
jgi:hypothetical protein